MLINRLGLDISLQSGENIEKDEAALLAMAAMTMSVSLPLSAPTPSNWEPKALKHVFRALTAGLPKNHVFEHSAP